MPLETTETTNFEKNQINRFHQVQWILAELFNLFAISSVIWIGVSLLIYGIRTGKWRKENRSSATQVNAGAVFTAAVISTFSSLLRLLPNQATLNLGYTDTSSFPCEAAMDASVAGYTLTMICIYCFLWLRQRSLYQHPAMASFNQLWLRCINWSSIMIIVSACIFAGIAFVWPENYTHSKHGCISRPTKNFTVWPTYLSNGIVLLGQGLMLFLFFWPLCSPLTTNTAKRVMKIMKRSAALAVASVVSDLIAMVILAFAVPESSTRHVTITVYDINMLVNILTVLFSFETWKTILASPCSCDHPGILMDFSPSSAAISADTNI